ncbi:MAG: acyl-CoA dehydrogenase family protein, partial [Actinobacteria bacterium]|nr:acyl-CoA dehydrogenase family protein [Actinomycetota bacterium]
MDFTLTPEQEMVRKTAAEFAAREIAPFAREWDREERMDRSIVGKLADVGFLGGPIPEEYGGMGLDNLAYCLLVEEIGKADSSVRGIISVNTGLVAKTVLKWGTEEQKQE